MNDTLGRRLREEDLAFFGRVGADVSHEMRNVLSVIGEYAGLLDDLVGLAEKRKPPDYAKLRKLAANIARQVAKGTETMERFSRFAHAADQPSACFDLTAVMRNMAALAGRHVSLAGATLEAELPDEPIPLAANPFALQRAVFSALRVLLEAPEKSDAIRLKLARREAEAVISVSGNAAGGDELTEPVARLSDLMSELGGSVETSVGDGTLSLILTLPIDAEA